MKAADPDAQEDPEGEDTAKHLLPKEGAKLPDHQWEEPAEHAAGSPIRCS
jgi:hypothetical protein